MDHELHLWLIDLDQPLPHAAPPSSVLAPDERGRLSSYLLVSHGQRFAAARAWLRLILGSYLNQAPETLRFNYGISGKPSLADADLGFNLSHTGGTALYAVTSGRAVGVDLESSAHPLPGAAELARQFFSMREQAALHAASDSQRDLLFYRYWTRKEAILKATGTGLSHPLETVDVGFSPAPSRGVVLLSGQPFTLWDIPLPSPLVAAACTAGAGWCPTFRLFSNDDRINKQGGSRVGLSH